MIFRLVLLGILVGLRLWGADSTPIRVITLCCMVATGYSLLFTLFKGGRRVKLPFNKYLGIGLVAGAVWTVGFLFYRALHDGINLPVIWVVCIAAAPFIGGVLIWRLVKIKQFHVLGGMLMAAALATVVVTMWGFASASLVQAQPEKQFPKIHFEFGQEIEVTETATATEADK